MALLACLLGSQSVAGGSLKGGGRKQVRQDYANLNRIMPNNLAPLCKLMIRSTVYKRFLLCSSPRCIIIDVDLHIWGNLR